MTPLELYQQALASGNYQADPQQKLAILELQRVYAALIARQNPNNWTKRLKAKFKKPQLIRGVYLWGSVGIGKTWLMDIFYQCLTQVPKLRLHFHRFMQEVHQQLKQLQGHADPLKLVAKQFAEKAQVICFDEFLVTDIVDAMILGNLLKALFAEGITLITTANTAPAELYRNGVQREYFMPAIHLLQENLVELHLTTVHDYRLRVLEQAGTYYFPLDDKAELFMQNSFQQLTGIKYNAGEWAPLLIEGREIAVISYSNQVAWFDFKVLCNIPRSQIDYLELARIFSTVLLSSVPKITENQDNIARYLINLVDIFYDARVKLIISAAVPVTELYEKGRLAFEFKRTKSRLLEMQSREYLRLPHLET